MNLLSLIDNKIVPSAECLTISEFAEIWNRDKNKSLAIKEIAYIYFIADYKSAYNNYPLLVKESKVKEDIIKDPNWKEDSIVSLAIKKYEDLQITPTLRLLKSARKALEEITRYYQTVRITSRDILSISSSLEKLGRITESFDKLENKVKNELQKEGKSKADREINYYET